MGGWRPTLRKSRKEQVIMSRLCIGHTKLTHSYILKQEQQPQCETCRTPLTVKHLFIECRVFAHIRNHYFNANNMKDLFEKVNIEDILSFLKKIKLYHRIWT